jgi:hypothetical protein
MTTYYATTQLKYDRRKTRPGVGLPPGVRAAADEDHGEAARALAMDEPGDPKERAAGAAVQAGASGTGTINVSDYPFEKIRLVYTATSGTGTLTAYIVAKGLGA